MTAPVLVKASPHQCLPSLISYNSDTRLSMTLKETLRYVLFSFTIFLFCAISHVLAHLPLVPHICVREPVQHWFRQCLGAYSLPNVFLNQCWVIVNWTNSREILIKIKNFSFTKMRLKISSAKWQPFCPRGYAQHHSVAGCRVEYFVGLGPDHKEQQ